MILDVGAQLILVEPVRTRRRIEIDSQGGRRTRTKRPAVREMRIGQVGLLPPEDASGAGAAAGLSVRVLGDRGVLRLLKTRPRIEDGRLSSGNLSCK